MTWMYKCIVCGAGFAEEDVGKDRKCGLCGSCIPENNKFEVKSVDENQETLG